MIHHVDSTKLDGLQRFSRLFDANQNFDLSKAHRLTDRNLWHFFVANPPAGNKVTFDLGGSLHQDRLSAAFGALGETVERRAFRSQKPDLFNVSFAELKKRGTPCLDPASFRMFAAEQPTLASGEAMNLDRTARIDWSWFEDRHRKILLPSQFSTFFQYKVPFYCLSSSNGNGCGQTATQAKLSGLLELLERDAVLFYWWTMNTPTRVRLDLRNPKIQKIVRPYLRSIDKITLFYLKTDFKIAAIFSVFRGDPKLGEPRFVVAAACHPNPLSAIERALNELTQVIFGAEALVSAANQIDFRLDFDQSIWDFSDHISTYANCPLEKAYQFLFPDHPEEVDVDDLPSVKDSSPELLLDQITADIRNNGARVYFRNLACREIRHANLFVYRAVSPDLAQIDFSHRYRHLGTFRYYELGRKLNLKRQPRHYRELNSYPHPFP